MHAEQPLIPPLCTSCSTLTHSTCFVNKQISPSRVNLYSLMDPFTLSLLARARHEPLFSFSDRCPLQKGAEKRQLSLGIPPSRAELTESDSCLRTKLEPHSTVIDPGSWNLRTQLHSSLTSQGDRAVGRRSSYSWSLLLSKSLCLDLMAGVSSRRWN